MQMDGFSSVSFGQLSVLVQDVVNLLQSSLGDFLPSPGAFLLTIAAIACACQREAPAEQ